MTATASEQTATVEVSNCPLCGSHATPAFSEPPYTVLRCDACGLGFVSPRRTPEGLVALYDDDYWRSGSPKSHGYHDYRADEPLYLRTFRRRVDYALRDGPRSGRALDVGCAAGFCMAILRERGFDVHGVEVSPAIAAHAIGHFGFDTVHIGPIETSGHEDRSFDLITMWDVVEHVPDPRALLTTARSLIRDDGRLVIETQDIDSRFARTLGPRWHHYKHAEHIYHFTPSTVTSLLASAGFVVERITHRYGGKYVSLQFIAERAGRIHPVLSRALSPLARLESANVYLNFMDEMIVVARPAP
jgi:2-polyprenyl-3-methyl-5-hydroxy-6-metoxy-1,4-benzoquinol methylase